MSEQPNFRPPSEAQAALEKESHLPLTGWQQEVDRGLEYGLEAAAVSKTAAFPPFPEENCPTMPGSILS